MDNYQIAYLYVTVAILTIGLIGNVSIIKANSRRIAVSIGPLGGYFLLAFSCLTQVLSLLWVLSLVPPFSNPSFYQTAVAYFSYGRNFSDYPAASIYIHFTTSFPLWLYVLYLRFCRSIDGTAPAFSIGEIARIGEKIKGVRLYLYMLVTVAVALLYFAGKGWDSLAIASSGRFDGQNVNLLTKYTPILQVVIFLGSLVSCSLLALPGEGWLKLLCWLVAALPLVVAQSRMLGVTCVVLIFVLFFRIKISIVRYIFLFPALVLAYLAYIVPLNLRGNDSVGLYFLVGTLNYIWANFDQLLSPEGIAPVVANLGMVLPNVSEMFTHSLWGTANPEEFWYYLLMLSPLPGSVDGFGELFDKYGKFHNAYTPFNTFSELGAADFYLPPLAFLFALFAYIMMFSMRTYSAFWDVAGGVLCLGSAFVFMIMASQYNPRICVKIIMMTLVGKLIIKFIVIFSSDRTFRGRFRVVGARRQSDLM